MREPKTAIQAIEKFKFEERLNAEIDLREARNIVIENEDLRNLYERRNTIIKYMSRYGELK